MSMKKMQEKSKTKKLSVLWRNRQTKAYLVLRPKLRNRHGDFSAQVTKP
jgi:hypothetical protein